MVTYFWYLPFQNHGAIQLQERRCEWELGKSLHYPVRRFLCLQ